jgi:hypothetical protein
MNQTQGCLSELRRRSFAMNTSHSFVTPFPVSEFGSAWFPPERAHSAEDNSLIASAEKGLPWLADCVLKQRQAIQHKRSLDESV